MSVVSPHSTASLDRTWAWLASRRDPSAELLLLRAGLEVPWGVGAAAARAAVLADATVVQAIAAQHDDGSWGADDRAAARILPTLWVVKALVGAGLGAGPPVDAALEFLAEHATTDDGYFTLSGTEKDVLPCYVGVAASLFRDAGRADLARAQNDWLTRFQQVVVAGEARRETQDWRYALDKRYGGCFASTSCLIGVVRATEAWSGGDSPDQRDALAVARESLYERELAFTRDGARLLDLPASRGRQSAWTLPAFPTDWRMDLVDVLHAVAQGAREPDQRAARAVEVLMASRREDGSWARGWHVTSPYLKGFGASPRGQGNPIATARVYVALTLVAGGPA